MKLKSLKPWLVATLLIVPLLNGCFDDDDDDDRPVPAAGDGGGDNGTTDPNSFSAIFSEPADGDAIDPDDPEALKADIDAMFGGPEDDPREPDEVLNLADS